MSKGWGFKIDYARAIADDDAMIANYQKCIEHGWYRRFIPYADGSGQFEVIDLWMLVLEFRDVSRAMGLSDQDVADYAAYVEYDVWERHPDLPDGRTGRDAYNRGKEIHAMVKDVTCSPLDEKQARKFLTQAKASRARHIRNRDKFGGPGSWRDRPVK
jgi:hypothetical protein